MPTRYLKPGVRDSELIDKLSPMAEILFYRLLVTVDDFGRFDARPSMIKSQCFPIKEDVTARKCSELMQELSIAGLIQLYEADGKPFLQMLKWDNKPRADTSKFPAISDGCIQTYTDVKHPRTLLPVTVTVTGTETVTGNREPETGNRNRKPKPKPTSPGASPVVKLNASSSVETWEAYREAYRNRYGTDPVRNAKVNAQLAGLVNRLGAAEAPEVARHYVGHQLRLYVQAGHTTDLLLRDCEKLRTEWATGRDVLARDASEADRLASAGAMYERVGAKLDAEGLTWK